jgi:hypothetical protein
MSENKVIKSVSFNITNEKDAAMLKHFKRRNFSGYVKKLIWNDMAGGEPKREPAPVPEPSVNERLEQMKKERRALLEE